MSLGLALVLLLADGVAPAQINPNDIDWDEAHCSRYDMECLFDYWQSLDETDPRPWERDPIIEEKLGPGPHTLIISDGDGMTRMEYASGPKCMKARDEVRRQNSNPPNTPGIIYGAPRVKAFCVPR